MVQTRLAVCLALFTGLLPLACSEESASHPDARPLAKLGAGAQPRSPDLMRILPPDAVLSLHFPDMATMWRQMQSTAYGDLFGHNQLQETLDKFEASFRQFTAMMPPSSPTSAAVVPSWEEVEKFLRSMNGELVLGVMNVQGFGSEVQAPELELIVGLTVTGAAAEARKILKLIFTAGQNDPTAKITEHDGLWSIRSKNSPWKMEVAIEGDVLLFGIGSRTVAAAVQCLRGEGRSKTLAGIERCFSENDAMRVHIDVPVGMNRYGPLLPESATTVLKTLGLDRLRSLSCAARIEDGQILLSSLWDSPGGTDVLTKCLSTSKVDLSVLDRLPPDFASYTLFALDPVKALAGLRSAMPASALGEFDDAIGKLSSLGIDLSDDTLALFGPQCVHLNLATSEKTSSDPDSLVAAMILDTAFLVQVRDPERVQELLAKLPEEPGGATRRDETQLGTPVIAYDIAYSGRNLRTLRPSIALHEGYLLIAMSDKAMGAMLRANSAVVGNKHRERLGKVPEEAISVAFDTMREGPGKILTTLLERIQNQYSTSRIADFDDMLRQGGTASSYTVADKRGIYSFTRSPTGSLGGMGGLAGLGIVASIAIPNLLKARRNANEFHAIATLKRIHRAQQTYKSLREADRDQDNVGEFAFLSDLIETRRGRKVMPGARSAKGRHLYKGYIFRSYLPGRGGVPVGDLGKLSNIVDADLAEACHIVVAWPSRTGTKGQRAFLMTTRGKILGCEDSPYGGARGPAPGVMSAESSDILSPHLRSGSRAADGNLWVEVR